MRLRGFLAGLVITVLAACGREEPRVDPTAVAVADPDRQRVELFWTRFRHATAQRVAGNIAEAAEAYRLALWLEPAHEDALYYLGNMASQLGRYDEAERAWRRLIEVNPASGRAHMQLGTLYACPDRTEFFRPTEAEAELRRAVEINQEQTGPLLRLAMVKLVQGESDSARELAGNVLRTNGNSVEGHLFAGLAAWRAGARGQAMEHLAAARAAAMPPTSADAVVGEGDTRTGVRLWRSGTGCQGPDAILSTVAEMRDGDHAAFAEFYGRLDRSLRRLR